MSAKFPWASSQSRDKHENFYERLSNSSSSEQQQQINDLLASNKQWQQQLEVMLDTSRYVQEQIICHPNHLIDLLSDNTIANGDFHLTYHDTLQNHGTQSPEEFDRFLRLFRAKAMMRIIWRDFNSIACFQETALDLSLLARACLNSALLFHHQQLTEKYGEPRNKEGEKQPFLIIGMGKLGANELNLSSDIDLIFTFCEKGQTDSPKRALDNNEFFSRLGKKIIHSIDAITSEGMVFRVDMRLRPYGQSGPLVHSFNALEEYYQSQGREWERYAMVKADVVASNASDEQKDKLMSMLRSFTYRKYIDFSVIDALRNLKTMIVQEVKRRGLQEDIKLGAGGIREIEFIAQVFQLIRGGREHALQHNGLLTILPLLAELNCLPNKTVDSLQKAYIFLRNTEHAIQGYNDEQSQKLPTNKDAQAALCRVMAFDSWQQFSEQLDHHRMFVQEVFADLIAAPENQGQQSEHLQNWISFWQSNDEKQHAQQQLADSGHENPELSYRIIDELRAWKAQANMHKISHERLDTFMPVLLLNLENTLAPSETLQRLIKLIKSVVRRSAYLLLLIENPEALKQLLKLTQASPWFGDRLAEHPALLDELLSPETLYHPPLRHELQSELTRLTLRIAEDDLEAQMEALRYFRSAHTLRVAASEITEALPLMKVSDYLTWIAEVILDYTLWLCWREMTRKHGYPDGVEKDIPEFIIVAYGKLGGIELGHGSDLDLVFIHNGSTNGYTDGKRSLDNQTFFMRLGQKIIHFLTTNMPSGDLYEVDMRLRPSGNSGMLVTSANSFAKYQQESAWTWEHQALVRARVIAGSNTLRKEFENIRADVLRRKRKLDVLNREVVEMRNKMRTHLGSDDKNEDVFHLKQDQGGIVDIEFMVQYGVLAWSHSHPALVTYTDNIRILESFAETNLLDTHEVDQLIKAYKAFRSAGHHLTLQQQPSIVDADQFVCERQSVSNIWRRLMTSSADI